MACRVGRTAFQLAFCNVCPSLVATKSLHACSMPCTVQHQGSTRSAVRDGDPCASPEAQLVIATAGGRDCACPRCSLREQLQATRPEACGNMCPPKMQPFGQSERTPRVYRDCARGAKVDITQPQHHVLSLRDDLAHRLRSPRKPCRQANSLIRRAAPQLEHLFQPPM